MQPKFVHMKMLLKTVKPANIRKWIARFYYFSIYTPLEARVLLPLHELPIDITLSALLINILGFLPVVFA